MKYVFSGMKSDETTVEADNEKDARHKAMVQRWGPPGDRVVPGDKYQGKGLSLIRTE